jgi:hypothetical protein
MKSMPTWRERKHFNTKEEIAIFIPHYVTKVEVHPSVPKILDNAFNYCLRLKNLVQCNHLKEIGYSEFSYCQSLEKPKLNPMLRKIQLSAIECCLGATELIIPKGVLKAIENQAFAKCIKITRVEIPDNVTNIGAMTFLSCVLLREVSFHTVSTR